MFKEHFFETSVASYNYVEGPPSGPPLVLFHGLAERWQTFLPIFTTLSLKWHIYALDFRGHGRSSWTSRQYKAKHYMEDVRAFLEHNISEPAVLFGYCIGGVVALQMAATRPEAVRAVVVGDAPITWEQIEKKTTGRVDTGIYSAYLAIAHSGRSVEDMMAALADVQVPVPRQSATVRYGDVPGIDSAFLRLKAEGLKRVDPMTLEFHAEGRIHEFLEGCDPTNLQQITCPVLLLQADPSHGGLMCDQDIACILSMLPQTRHMLFRHIKPWYGLERGRIEPAVLQAMISFLDAL